MVIGRIITVTGAIVLLVLGGMVGWYTFHDPSEENRVDLAWDLEQVRQRRDNPGGGSESVNFATLEREVVERDDLWDELIEPRPERPSPPDLAGPLRGVTITRESIGSGNEVQIRIRTSDNNRGEWKGIGDEVNGLTIRQITSDSVIFSKRAHGREYTRSVDRGGR